MKVNMQDVLGLAGYLIKNKKPTVSGTIPTVNDLKADLNYSEAIPIEEAPNEDNSQEPSNSQIESKGTACIPCSLSHVTACVGELNEAARFAREDITNPEVTKRVDHCLGEIVACERIDLAPESTASLPPQEREIADSIAKELRDIRHGLEWYKTKDDLEDLAAKAANLQHDTSQRWLRLRLANMSEPGRSAIKEKMQELLGEER